MTTIYKGGNSFTSFRSDEIAQSIAKALKLVLTEQEKRAIEKAPTTDVQAYDYYLKGRQFFHQFRRKSFDFARQLFARAIVIDPNYALAYAGVAEIGRASCRERV